MQRHEIADRLRRFISEDLLDDHHDLDLEVDDALLLEDLLDSLAVVRLGGFIDEELSIAVPPESITVEHFATIAALADFLDALD